MRQLYAIFGFLSMYNDLFGFFWFEYFNVRWGDGTIRWTEETIRTDWYIAWFCRFEYDRLPCHLGLKFFLWSGMDMVWWYGGICVATVYLLELYPDFGFLLFIEQPSISARCGDLCLRSCGEYCHLCYFAVGKNWIRHLDFFGMRHTFDCCFAAVFAKKYRVQWGWYYRLPYLYSPGTLTTDILVLRRGGRCRFRHGFIRGA